MNNQSYRRSKATKKEHTKWEMTYGMIAAKLLRTGKLKTQDCFTVAKFLGAFVYIYSYPYGLFKMLKFKLKLAKIRHNEKKK